MDVIENLERKIKNIEEKDKEVNAFIEVYFEEARKRATEISKKIERGEAGKLAGLIVAVKNNIAVKGKKLTCASKILENHRATYNATVVERILREDGIIIGSTNMDEFACGNTTSTSAFFKTRNPYDLERIPGGSSGGSAVAVALDMCDCALGSDTGGSIRCPAAFCGVYGFKPTYGLVSRYGLVDMAMSLDQIGTFGKDLKTAKILFDVIKGPDEKDPTTVEQFEMKKKMKKKMKGKVGIFKEISLEKDVEISFKDALRKIEKNFEVIEVSFPYIDYFVPIYYLTMAAEFSSAMQRYDGLRYGVKANRNLEIFESYFDARGNFGEEVKRRIILGTYITSKEYKEKWYTITLKARATVKKELKKLFEEIDFIVTPTMPCLPWKFDEKLKPIQSYVADVLTVFANLAGLPAISVPYEKFIGIQIVGDSFCDEEVFEAASMIK